MKIDSIDIQNFRKLISCRIDLDDKQTLFVGANNSGKTSAMDALILFLQDKSNNVKKFSLYDFTRSYWQKIDVIGKKWIEQTENSLTDKDLYIKEWREFLPSVDIWFNVNNDELHHIIHLIPTLSWNGGKLGVRLVFEPKYNDDFLCIDLYRKFIEAYQQTQATPKHKENKLWPTSLSDFLAKNLNTHFKINTYLLDPTKREKNGKPQLLPENSLYIGNTYPFKGLIKVDIINAQRGFSDDKSNLAEKKLSMQLRNYYDKHINFQETPSENDLEALKSIQEAQEKFNQELDKGFKSAISELQELGYPGFTDPNIKLSGQFRMQDSLNHDSAVLFNVTSDDELLLPEKYNGLGYQNLISIVFKLIAFRDSWMQIGKIKNLNTENESVIPPLHLVLIEEPEAHLHAQVQQVFMKKAYSVLRNHKKLEEKKQYNTQMLISTHSSHIAHEIAFECLRYFKRIPISKPKENKPGSDAISIPTAEIINLSDIFGDDNATNKFASRYLKATHCDLFFADAAILVEGLAERLLLPSFIKGNYSSLKSSYLTILEIGGSHTHKFKNLIEKLGIHTLIITDVDSVEKEENKSVKIKPEQNKNYLTSNATLKKWLPKKDKLDELLNCTDNEKTSNNGSGLIRVAYQCPFSLRFKNETDEIIIPYTFEDAVAFSNIEFFKNLGNTKGLTKKIQQALNSSDLNTASDEIFKAINTSKGKAEMALDILYSDEIDNINVPEYINDGLTWLDNALNQHKQDISFNNSDINEHE